MNRFKQRLHAHSRKVFLNTDRDAVFVDIAFGDGQEFLQVPAQLHDSEQSDRKSRNSSEYVENVYDASSRLIVASDAFGFIPKHDTQIAVNDEWFVVVWTADREGLLYIDLARPTM